MLELVLVIALETGVPFEIARGLVLVENPRLDPRAVGVTGDLGLFQLNPRYLDWFVKKFWTYPVKFDVYSPFHNTTVALRYLKWIKDTYKWDWWTCVVAYNAGPERVVLDGGPSVSHRHATAVWRHLIARGRSELLFK